MDLEYWGAPEIPVNLPGSIPEASVTVITTEVSSTTCGAGIDELPVKDKGCNIDGKGIHSCLEWESRISGCSRQNRDKNVSALAA